MDKSNAALAHATHEEFRRKPESQHIATAFALSGLAELVSRLRPRSVLEIGGGIGTITKLLLTHPGRPEKLVVTESNAICLRELEANLKGLDQSGLRVVTSAGDMDFEETFDLVIFDGVLDKKLQSRLLKAGTWIFVEGGRHKTILELRCDLQSRGLEIKAENVRRPRRFEFLSRRKVLGMRLPALKFRSPKGYSAGQVVARPG